MGYKYLTPSGKEVTVYKNIEEFRQRFNKEVTIKKELKRYEKDRRKQPIRS
jgi:hypothetical protein